MLKIRKMLRIKEKMLKMNKKSKKKNKEYVLFLDQFLKITSFLQLYGHFKNSIPTRVFEI